MAPEGPTLVDEEGDAGEGLDRRSSVATTDHGLFPCADGSGRRGAATVIRRRWLTTTCSPAAGTPARISSRRPLFLPCEPDAGAGLPFTIHHIHSAQLTCAAQDCWLHPKCFRTGYRHLHFYQASGKPVEPLSSVSAMRKRKVCVLCVA